MKNLIIITLSFFLVTGQILFASVPAANAGTYTNTLVKGPGPAVYWVADNGKRYVFPNIQTFWSWYPTDKLKEVKTLTISQLAEIPLGGLVAYRPGAKLIKFQSSPKVYAVSRYGILHWISNPSIAALHYGFNWASKVEEVPDAFASSYTIGDPLQNVWDFNGGNEYNTVTNPSLNLLQDLPTGSLSLNLSKYEVAKGESAVLKAELAANSQLDKIKINLLTDKNVLLKTCNSQTACEVSVALPGEDATRSFKATATYTTPSGDKTLSSNTTTLRRFLQQSNFRGSTLIQSEVYAPGNELPVVRIVVTTLNASVVDTDLITRVYRKSDNTLIQTCAGGVTCTAKDTLPNLTQSTDVSYFAIVSNKNNQALPPAETKVTVLPQGWYPAYNSYTFTAASYGNKTGLTNELEQQSQAVKLDYATFTSNGKILTWSDDNSVIASGDSVELETKISGVNPNEKLNIEIRDLDGNVYQICNGVGSVVCKAYLSFKTEYKNYFFIIRVRDNNSRIKDFRLPEPIYIGGKQGFGGAVRLLVNRKEAMRGDDIYISTKIMNETSPIAKITSRIYNLETGAMIAACTWSSECRTKTVADTNFPTHNYYVIATDGQGREMHASYNQYPVKIAQ